MERYRVRPGTRITLSVWDPSDQSFFPGEKEEGQERLRELNEELEELQELLYAEHKQKVLIVLQGMDTSGKDGVGTFSATESLNLKSGDLEKHREKIQDATVKSIVIRFSDFVGTEGAKYSGSIQMPDLVPDTYYMKDFDVSEYAKNGTDLVIYEKDGVSFPDDTNFPGDELIGRPSQPFLEKYDLCIG